MKIEIHTSAPLSLWMKIKEDISNKKIKTWVVVLNGAGEELLTHIPAQWFKKALLKPTIGEKPNRLILTVTWFIGENPDQYTKGLYVGRFTEELLEHYYKDFLKIETFP
ncbi:MAG: hypothetical protein JWQ25_1467 [Daejeonella sp.]|nr:hypothetical protein [Daejeonella sp.]